LCVPGTRYSGPERWGTSSYIGISGAATTSDPAAGGGQNRCATGNYGYVCANGALIPNSSLRFSSFTDGTTNQIFVGEHSDFSFDASGIKDDIRSSMKYGFYMGAGSIGRPGSGQGTWTGENDTYNITTVRYAVGYKTKAEGAPGSMYYGTNLAIQSPHPGGAMVLRGDGGTNFLSSSTDFTVLTYMCVRDDGNVLTNNPLQ